MGLPLHGFVKEAEPGPSERCRRACRYEFFRRLSDSMSEEIGRCLTTNTPLPAHLAVYASVLRIDDYLVHAMIAFEGAGETSLEDMPAAPQPMTASLISANPERGIYSYRKQASQKRAPGCRHSSGAASTR